MMYVLNKEMKMLTIAMYIALAPFYIAGAVGDLVVTALLLLF